MTPPSFSPDGPEASSSPASAIPERRRQFALHVVQRLRKAGFQALWAGGCVRDALRGLAPKDFDVASSATPQQVIELFGQRRTIPVGVSFGVVIVQGPDRDSGQVEVATFRSDGQYLDGRRPVDVQFCSPEQDALRRDFTVNGMFFDPVDEQVLDYVGGLDDLKSGRLRAIGDAVERFQEDKLRMLRAVRFTATLAFQLDPDTAAAIKRYHNEIQQVSAERIAQELRRMLEHPSRERAVQLLSETKLLPAIFPDLYPLNLHLQDKAIRDSFRENPATGDSIATETSTCAVSGTAKEICSATTAEFDWLRPWPSADRLCRAVGMLSECHFETSLCVLLLPLYDTSAGDFRQRTVRLQQSCRELKLSIAETECVTWLADSLRLIRNADQQPLHILKPLLSDVRAALLLDLSQALARAADQNPVDAHFCQEYLRHTPRDVLNPTPLIGGEDLKRLGVPAGPQYRILLDRVRCEQLDEVIRTRDSALLRLQELLKSAETGRI